MYINKKKIKIKIWKKVNYRGRHENCGKLQKNLKYAKQHTQKVIIDRESSFIVNEGKKYTGNAKLETKRCWIFFQVQKSKKVVHYWFFYIIHGLLYNNDNNNNYKKLQQHHLQQSNTTIKNVKKPLGKTRNFQHVLFPFQSDFRWRLFIDDQLFTWHNNKLKQKKNSLTSVRHSL